MRCSLVRYFHIYHGISTSSVANRITLLVIDSAQISTNSDEKTNQVRGFAKKYDECLISNERSWNK